MLKVAINANYIIFDINGTQKVNNYTHTGGSVS